MNEAGRYGLNEVDTQEQNPGGPTGRAFGAPLPMGSGGRPRPSSEDRPIPPPGRALPEPAEPQTSGADRAMGLLRSALPFVQRLLPILDSGLGAAVSSLLLTHRPASQPAPPPVNLVPLESGLTELQTQHRDLRNQVIEQNTSLKRVEDRLEMVREATDRNTLEQQELMEDLKAVGTKINVFAFVALLLLAGSILLNILLLMHIERVLP